MIDILKNKTAIITGGSRGIGLAIAKKLAAAGVNVVVAAKTTEPHPKLPGTIYEAAEEIKAMGGNALALILDLRDEAMIEKVVQDTVAQFGGIDILVNNASAIYLAGIEHTPSKRYDLMHQINVRGTFLMSQACIPFLKKSSHPHILNLSPPLDMNPAWFENYTAYTMSKFGMSMVALGLSAELKPYGIAANALWPRTTIATAAVQNLLGGDALIRQSRWPAIVADAAAIILSGNPKETTGQFFIDETVLRERGITDFTGYAVDPTTGLAPDLFITL
ncbi:MAG: NAD(P)-dependent oxidoreductase [Saprospiraceae bacterium]|nr:NAD(P)-dependent oxidoreductase [Saprospiraceae bacterium]